MSRTLVQASRALTAALQPLRFPSASHVYLPTDYARIPHEIYLERCGSGKKKVLFLGMNPGPWGMAQTGVPFGEIAAVRDWMGITGKVAKPDPEHPKRPILGFHCTQSEVSGRRLWGHFADRFPRAADFFKDHFVANYCPLVWMGPTGANLTPDKLPAAEMEAVEQHCLTHLRETIEILDPEYLIGVGAFAESRLAAAADALGHPARIGRILHPSPASPAANRGWAQAASAQLHRLGLTHL